jgi:hypothetical protein
MPHKATAADSKQDFRMATTDDEMDFCIGVQRCQFKRCKKNGTHHLHINSTCATKSGSGREDVLDRWYCDEHFKLIVPSTDIE